MAKRGRRSIRNKRKSVKKYSSKRRSKTMRYLRGGGVKMLPSDNYIRGNNPEVRVPAGKPLGIIVEENEYEKKGGGRRRYYRRKQSKSRSRKH